MNLRPFIRRVTDYQSVGIDLDSTLNCLDEAWADWVTYYHDATFTRDKWTRWDIHTLTPAGTKVYDFLAIPNVFRRLKVAAHAQAVTKALVDLGKDVFVVSASIPEVWPDKCGWLREFFPHLDRRNFIACERKGRLRLDVLVDDGAHNFAGFEGYGIVLDRPWNQSFEGVADPPVIRRALDWPAVAALLAIDASIAGESESA